MTDTVYYTCSFVPPELIRACGFRPCRLAPISKNIPQFQIEGMCSLTKAWLENLQDIANRNEACIAVFTTSCDQMRRAFDLICKKENIRAFLLDIPKTINEQSLCYYQHELLRLASFLCELSGESFNEDHLNIFLQEKKPPLQNPESHRCMQIAIMGGPVPETILKHLEHITGLADARIGLHLTENHITPDESSKVGSLKELGESYCNIPAIWKRPNNAFYDWLESQVQNTKIDAVLLFRHIFCDLWHSQVNEFKRRLQIPVLDIELDGQETLSAAAVSRVQAFLETLVS